MDATVIVATFGGPEWRLRAEVLAVPSAVATGRPVIVHHEPDDTLATARNAAAARARTEWLVFLDADDELEPGYLDALDPLSGDLRAPAVRYVPALHRMQCDPETCSCELDRPLELGDRNIDVMNPCVIGTAIRRSTFADVGGFLEWRAWEDWCLFRRAWLLGATIEHTPAAVYRAHVDPAGRNSTVDEPNRLHKEIRRAHRAWLVNRGNR